MRPNPDVVAELASAYGRVEQTPDLWTIRLDGPDRLRYYFTDSWAVVWVEQVDARGCSEIRYGRVLLEVVDGRWAFMAITDASQQWSIPERFRVAVVGLVEVIMGHARDTDTLKAAMASVGAVHYAARKAQLGCVVNDYTVPPDDAQLVRQAIARALTCWRDEHRVHAALVLINQRVPAQVATLTIDGLTVYLTDLATVPWPAIHVFGPMGTWRSQLSDWVAPNQPHKHVVPSAVTLESLLAARNGRAAPPKTRGASTAARSATSTPTPTNH